MAILKVDGKGIELNEDGFLSRPEEWNENVARAFALLDNISELDDDHWKVICYLEDKLLWISVWLFHISLALILVGHVLGICFIRGQFTFIGLSSASSGRSSQQEDFLRISPCPGRL